MAKTADERAKEIRAQRKYYDPDGERVNFDEFAGERRFCTVTVKSNIKNVEEDVERWVDENYSKEHDFCYYVGKDITGELVAFVSIFELKK